MSVLILLSRQTRVQSAIAVLDGGVQSPIVSNNIMDTGTHVAPRRWTTSDQLGNASVRRRK